MDVFDSMSISYKGKKNLMIYERSSSIMNFEFT